MWILNFLANFNQKFTNQWTNLIHYTERVALFSHFTESNFFLLDYTPYIPKEEKYSN